VSRLNEVHAASAMRIDTLAGYIDAAPELTPSDPCWRGEMRSGARANVLMGVASARIDIKQAAARAERLLERYAEPLSALHVAPDAWPAAFLRLAWGRVIENSAHDSICGCSIDPVVDQVLVRFAEAEQIAGTLARRASVAVAASVPRGAVAVLNPTPAPRLGLVEAELLVPDEWAAVALELPDGSRVATQELSRKEAILFDTELRGDDVDDLFRRFHGREIFDHAWNGYRIDGRTVTLEVDNDPDPIWLDVDGLRAEVVAAMRAAPPQAPVTVAVTSTVRPMRILSPAATAEPHPMRSALGRFVERSVNEEALAAEYALFQARDTTGIAQPSLAVVWAAVSMRAYGQERVWFPGDGGPSVVDLKGRFGLAAVSFDADVPTIWRPYYLRMLGSALADLQRVLPAFAARGLGVHFGESPMRDAALAMHDPATRTIFLPVGTSAGVIAHELAHDLDWQAARTRYGLRGTYSTDRAVRQYRDRLAASMLELSDAGAGESSLGADGVRALPSARPTEVFARNVDWFVSAVLARDGRMNGYLSAVQDGLLTGYGAVAAPEVSRDGAEAMISALDEMTLVAPATRTWFVDVHGKGRTMPIGELTRRVLDVPLTAADRRRIGVETRAPSALVMPSGEASARTLVAIGAGCRDGVIDDHLAEQRAEVLLETADARARGLLARRARFAASSDRAPWQLRALLGNAWAPDYADRARLEIRDAILHRAVLAATPRGVTAIVASTPLGCR
jgi:hypothetical protein